MSHLKCGSLKAGIRRYSMLLGYLGFCQATGCWAIIFLTLKCLQQAFYDKIAKSPLSRHISLSVSEITEVELGSEVAIERKQQTCLGRKVLGKPLSFHYRCR